MKETTKQRRHDELMAQLLGKTVEEIRATRDAEEQDDKLRQAQAIHLFLEKPSAFAIKECGNCGGSFLTTYKYVSDCSNSCRVKSLRKIGIEWNPYRTADERWRRAKIPVEYSIPPEALKVLLEIAEQQQSRNHEQLNNESHTDLDLTPVLLESDETVHSN